MVRQRAAALALLVAGLAGAVGAERLAIGSPARPGPGFFPFWLALALAVVAVALLVRATSVTSSAEVAGPRLQHGKVVMTLLATIGYAAALEPLGFVLTTFLFLAFLLIVVEPRSLVSVLVIAAATSMACHVVFKVWLNVQLPTGPWGF